MTAGANAARAERAGYRVRPMRVEDAERIAEVHVQVWREAYRYLMPPDDLASLDVQEFTSRWSTRLANPASSEAKHMVGVHPDGRIVAIGSAGPSRDLPPRTGWELWAINLLAAEHGTGLADLMMTELIGDRACSLWMLQGNERALAFYARYGFETDGHTKPHPPTGKVETRLVRDRERSPGGKETVE